MPKSFTPAMQPAETLRRLKEIAAHSRELEARLAETNRSFDTCAASVSAMEAVSHKVARVFALYRDLVGLLNKQDSP